MAAQSAQKRSSPQAEIPDRLYYRIGDVAKFCAVEPYVLRFWETQFPQLKPNKGGTGQRLYRRRELDMALRIKTLVHDEGYTLAGARQALESPTRLRAVPTPTGQPIPVNQPNLALNSDQAQQRLDAAMAAIGRTRAELREIASQLAVQQPTIKPRRARLASFKASTESLFPE